MSISNLHFWMKANNFSISSFSSNFDWKPFLALFSSTCLKGKGCPGKFYSFPKTYVKLRETHGIKSEFNEISLTHRVSQTIAFSPKITHIQMQMILRLGQHHFQILMCTHYIPRCISSPKAAWAKFQRPFKTHFHPE